MSFFVRIFFIILLFCSNIAMFSASALAENESTAKDPIFLLEKRQKQQREQRSIADITREKFQQQKENTYTRKEILQVGNHFFGGGVSNFASMLEEVFSKEGRPVAYILGEEGSGAFILGVTYGQGIYRFKTGAKGNVFWQGPSIGLDTGASLSKTIVMIYNATAENDLQNNFIGVSSSLYYIAGFAVSIRSWRNVRMVFARFGVGLRLGINLGYLKYRFVPITSPI